MPFLAFSESYDPTESGSGGTLARAAASVARLPQRGGDLGERLLDTFREILERRRHAAAVIFGSDSPTLPPDRLAGAIERLREGAEVVLGPAEDGGYCLVGATRAAPEIFTDIPWGTSGVLLATLAAIARAGLRSALLPPWYDVDRPEDLPRLRRDLEGPGRAAGTRTAAVLEELARTGHLP